MSKNKLKGASYLWDALTEDVKASRLKALRKRIKPSPKAEERRQLATEEIRKPKKQIGRSLEREYRQAEGLNPTNLHDGWARLFTLNRFDQLHFDGVYRLEEKWLEPLCSKAGITKDMTKWPEKMRPKSNPWKKTHIIEAQVLVPIWHEDIEQWEVRFRKKADGGVRKRRKVGTPHKRIERPNYIEVSVFFTNEFIKEPDNPDYLLPVKQAIGRPWKKSDGRLKPWREPKLKVWEPGNYEMRIIRETRKGLHTVMACKTHLIRKANRDHPENTKLHNKAVVEFWLDCLGLAVK